MPMASPPPPPVTSPPLSLPYCTARPFPPTYRTPKGSGLKWVDIPQGSLPGKQSAPPQPVRFQSGTVTGSAPPRSPDRDPSPFLDPALRSKSSTPGRSGKRGALKLDAAPHCVGGVGTPRRALCDPEALCFGSESAEVRGAPGESCHFLEVKVWRLLVFTLSWNSLRTTARVR